MFFWTYQKNKNFIGSYFIKKKNLLYKDIDINYTLLNNQNNKFIVTDMMSYILQYNANYDGKKRDIANFEIKNFENELYYIINNTCLNNFGLLNSCLYSDANDD